MVVSLNRAHYQQRKNSPSKQSLARGVTFDLQHIEIT